MSTSIVMPSKSQYAIFGRYVAAFFGSSSELGGGDTIEAVTEAGNNILGVALEGGEALVQFWRSEAVSVGIDLDPDEVCAEESCFASLDDGEGSDGFCGTHADERYCENCEESFATREDRDEHDCDS